MKKPMNDILCGKNVPERSSISWKTLIKDQPGLGPRIPDFRIDFRELKVVAKLFVKSETLAHCELISINEESDALG